MFDLKDCSYRNPNGEWVSGAAAFTHYVFTEKGGVDEFIRDYLQGNPDFFSLKKVGPFCPIYFRSGRFSPIYFNDVV